MVLTRSARKSLPPKHPDKEFKELPKNPKPKAKTLYSKYQSLLIARPYIVNSLQSAATAAAGAITASLFQPKAIDTKEVLIYAVLAGLIMAPASVAWYSQMAKKSWAAHVKLILEWVILTPVLNIVFVVSKAALEEQKLPAEEKWRDTAKLTGFSLFFWVPWGVLRTSLLPAHLYVAFNAFGAYLWQILLVSMVSYELLNL
mmetsp:Transcript_9473/g.23338  ORF Transcript_9473/g.23338 Transcript_9473/m.23338 type:complete len:201 (+) Transcript_9473:95-697(+)|eukprot:CAMPEP_0114514856 /NCGR_PEP_ID=MMETSP0109-20121206/16392_1 /TAXON_ID=29199 /ORGANISM="Chlorarachnion reptans, Strain CCCM449" /LENGTH=200 /DNA_ID=CAMNT_0001694955 /DNA_START=56 /DNA_END=658 /DNA_ORIENTATION=+